MKDHGVEHEFTSEYARGGRRKSAHLLDLSVATLGQKCSHCCPRHCPQDSPPETDADSGEIVGPLGAPISIQDVAAIIGVSAWTVRQRFLPAGLPHLRKGRQGKLLFYKNQIIHWLLTEQQKGGTNP